MDSTPTTNPHLAAWVYETAKLTKPDRVVWCDGSERERVELTREAVDAGALIPLNHEKLPGSYLHRSNPNDVARVEQLTFICTERREEVGPTNNWMHREDAYRKLTPLFDGSMRGRTMYVVPYLMGPVGSAMAKVGVELTDSVYVVLNMRIMTRMGQVALHVLGDSNDFNRGLHALGEVRPDRRFICHFPEDNTIWSIGSGYGGNVLLSKKCFSLRIGSWLGRQQGWLAEHMLLLGVQSPQGETTYVAAAFPSQCGKTNFSMLVPPKSFDGWKVFTVGDDIAWMHIGQDGRLWAVNPEAGYFGVVPGTNEKSNPNAMRIIGHDTLYTNVAETPDGSVWWEGKDGAVPDRLIDWQGRPWTPATGEKAAHPNSRFTSSMWNNPVLDPHADDPNGIPISAIVFGGRRSDTVPLAMEAFDWAHGVYLGATLASETTAAAAGAVGVVRRDPMAMLPFCGYDMGEYFGHWLSLRQRLSDPPKMFMVNWFRRGDDGKFLWPGYGENMRVLKWIVDRVRGRAIAHETPAGLIPAIDDLNIDGLALDRAKLSQALRVSPEEWAAEADLQQELFDKLARTMPGELIRQREMLRERLRQRRGLGEEAAASAPAP
ncbi:MAG TPA: phosphoenolpyruvate carboxykinase (GTP) [Myxococcales bacterium]|jgi:phosphoenolpyruvate carboxykinase (GTP)